LFFGPPSRAATEENDRRRALHSERKERSKIRVCRYKNTILTFRKFEDLKVASGLQSQFAQMHGVVAV